jgi:hypothetical protein
MKWKNLYDQEKLQHGGVILSAIALFDSPGGT